MSSYKRDQKSRRHPVTEFIYIIDSVKKGSTLEIH